MQSIYKAILRGDRIEWEEDVPEQIRNQAALSVFVTIPDQPVVADDTRGTRMAEALERLAASGCVASINDPLQWQREEQLDKFQVTGPQGLSINGVSVEKIIAEQKRHPEKTIRQIIDELSVTSG